MPLSSGNINILTQQALSQAGLAIIPQLQTALRTTLVNTVESAQSNTRTKDAFSDQALKLMKAALMAELASSFSKAPLAAVSELAASNINRQASQTNQIADQSFFQGLSESGDESSTSETDRALTPATPGAEAVEGAPGGSVLPPTEGGMPVARPGQPTAPVSPYDLRKQQRQEQNAESTSSNQPAETAEAEQDNDSPYQYAGTPEQQLQHQLQRSEQLETEAQAEEEVRNEVNAIKEKNKPGSTRGYASRKDVNGAQNNSPTPDAGSLKQSMIAKAANALGSKLADNIKNGVMENYQLIIGLAVLKDAIDYAEIAYGDPGITGTIIDIIAKIVFAALLSAQKNTFRKRLIKKYVGRILVALVIELIPVANEFIPAYTIDAVTIYVDNELTRRREKGQLQQVQSMMKRLKGKRRKPNQATLRNYQRSINDISKQADT